MQELLPASCKLITGIAVSAAVKQEGESEEATESLSFPLHLISNLSAGDSIANLFYSYLRTRASQAESRDFFVSDILPEIVNVMSGNILYACLDEDEQSALSDNIAALFNTRFADYLYDESGLYEQGLNMSDLAFAELIAREILNFFYLYKSEVFIRKSYTYKRPEAYECGNISLLVNGNSFLLRDYIITANRKLRNMSKEVIPFHEPLEVNSNIHTVFKSNKNSGDNTVTIRIYIEYETLSQKERQEQQR